MRTRRERRRRRLRHPRGPAPRAGPRARGFVRRQVRHRSWRWRRGARSSPSRCARIRTIRSSKTRTAHQGRGKLRRTRSSWTAASPGSRSSPRIRRPRTCAVGADEKSAMFAEIDARRCVAHAQMRARERRWTLRQGGEGHRLLRRRSHDSEDDFKRLCDRADARVYARVMMSRAEVHLRTTIPRARGDLRDAWNASRPTRSGVRARLRDPGGGRGRLHEASARSTSTITTGTTPRC